MRLFLDVKQLCAPKILKYQFRKKTSNVFSKLPTGKFLICYYAAIVPRLG